LGRPLDEIALAASDRLRSVPTAPPRVCWKAHADPRYRPGDRPCARTVSPPRIGLSGPRSAPWAATAAPVFVPLAVSVPELPV